MNVAESFDELTLCVKTKWKHKLNIVPIILLPPPVVHERNLAGALDYLLNYYDIQTGKLQFFFPGYTFKGQSIAITIDRLNDLYYNDKAFSDTVASIEKASCETNRIGYSFSEDAELLLVPFDRVVLRYDSLFRFNLTSLYKQGNGMQLLRNFIGSVIAAYRQCHSNRELIDRISIAYSSLLYNPETATQKLFPIEIQH